MTTQPETESSIRVATAVSRIHLIVFIFWPPEKGLCWVSSVLSHGKGRKSATGNAAYACPAGVCPQGGAGISQKGVDEGNILPIL